MIKKKRKICVFSGKRGGFGAYLPLMRLIDKDSRLELQILLGDMHASEEFGNTADEARKFFPKSKIEIIEMGAGRGDSSLIRAENLGTCLQKSAQILERLKPDILMVHSDRGEHLMAAFAALNLGIPIVHTQGGEVSGNIDDIQRHAITKIAHLHFPETRAAADRIKKMCEQNWRIKTVGSMYIDRIVKKMYSPFNGIREKYGLGPGEKYFIIIFHPDTFESKDANYKVMKNILQAVKSFKLRSFIVYPCSDPGYSGVLKAIKEIECDSQFLIHKNIDNLDFLSLMENALAFIGNSSCALVEAPYFNLPAVNVGKRQIGRDREENVVDALPSQIDIRKKINFVLTNAKFRDGLKKCGYRLGDGKASERIVRILKNITLNERFFRKRMSPR